MLHSLDFARSPGRFDNSQQNPLCIRNWTMRQVWTNQISVIRLCSSWCCRCISPFSIFACGYESDEAPWVSKFDRFFSVNSRCEGILMEWGFGSRRVPREASAGRSLEWLSGTGQDAPRRGNHWPSRTSKRSGAQVTLVKQKQMQREPHDNHLE